ncbi:cbb3-type cytochrome oxidase assembly protein CcoS [Chitinibacter bivalviorum]|uniref:Cbb3-type cytochrome oxidase assembly protein CcoS n=1 Tax=Chitinibacter bivalviorum TaxID=2739434 RepID=A0A7H9BHP5_9NEIS|nr:cbb3-type cytochrome oxidase assembly protein CcoS [Chitinibacter bivalviorum]QLG87852.1 cbb3-type cytochrome oxidase assembly protein CcoS [Chitinibacter bivalviorum]
MESLYLLIPLSLLIALGIGLIFWWFIRSGQTDDLEGPSWRILQDDDTTIESTTPGRTPQKKNPD